MKGITWELFKAMKWELENSADLADDLNGLMTVVKRYKDVRCDLVSEYREYIDKQNTIIFYLVFAGSEFDMLTNGGKVMYVVPSPDYAKALVRRLRKNGKCAYWCQEPTRWT